MKSFATDTSTGNGSMFKKNELQKFRHEMLLFTDGCPNIDPPRGHVNSMKNYVEQNEIPASHSVKTFGFGYSLDSKLLEEIAVEGNGSFSFIPDAGMVGTIFIHAVSSILS